MNNAINEIKNTLEGTNSRIMEGEDRISEVEDRMVEINETERKKENKLKEMRTISETSGTMWNALAFESWVPEEEDKKKGHEKILEEIVENFPKMGKKIITQVWENQRVPNRINPR